MKNKTKSEIKIGFEHIDNAMRFERMLNRLSVLGQYGGNLIIKVDDEQFDVGHDINIKYIKHEINE